MKVGTILLAVVFGGAAVATALWFGKYSNEPTETKESDDKYGFGDLVGPPPQAVCEDVVYDFGSMEKNTEGEHVFTIRNEGEGVLKLLKGKASCKCTTFKLGDDEKTKRMELKKGESVDVTVAWKVEKMMTDFKQEAPIHTNDPKNPYVPITIIGKVVAKYFVHPFRTLTAQDMVGNEAVYISGYVGSQLFGNAEIESIETSSDLFTVTPTQLKGEELNFTKDVKVGFRLDIEISPKIPVGRFQENFTVTLKNEDGTLSKEKFGVATNRVGPITVIGRKFDEPTMTLDLGTFSKTDGVSADLNMFVRSEEKTEDLYFKVVDSTNEHVKLKVVRDEKYTGKGERYKVTIAVPPGELKTADSSGRAEIFVETNHPELKMLKFRTKYLAY